jgi:hypothetical protein
MDFLYFNPCFQVLICTRYEYALVPGTIASYLASRHKDEVTKSERRDCVEMWKKKPLQSTQVIRQLDLLIDTLPIPNLALFHNSMRCRLCPQQPYVCGGGTITHMQLHLKTVHRWKGSDKGSRPTKEVAVSRQAVLLLVIATPISYQTFYQSNFTCFFQVATLLEPDWGASEAHQSLPPTLLKAQIDIQLAEKTRAADARASTVLPPPPKQSAWLQTMEWVWYLQGHDLDAAAQLIALPHLPEPEPNLIAILNSLNRLIEQARDSVLQGKINAFDQQRINSFLRSGSRTSKASDRLLAHKLKEGTYKKYKKT